MVRHLQLGLVSALTAVVGCTMPNPAFDDADSLADEESGAPDTGGEAETGDHGSGDGDPGDGDGDGDPGDGDGDGDPECVEPSGGFMDPCLAFIDPCEVGECLVFEDGPIEEGKPGVCTWFCESDEDCVWGSADQCMDERIQCIPALAGRQQVFVCAIPCEFEHDCFPGQFCHPIAGVCAPLP